MPQKLIDGNITIEDKASQALSKIEKSLRHVTETAKETVKQIKELNAETVKTAGNNVGQFDSRRLHRLAEKSILKDMDIAKIEAKSRAKRAYFDRLDSSISLRGLNRQASITQQEGLRMQRQAEFFNKQKELAKFNSQLHSSQLAEREASQKRVIDYKKEVELKTQQVRLEQRLARQEAKAASLMRNRTDWQKRMNRLAAGGGRLAPLWESLGKASSAISVARSPHLITEGLGGVFGKLGAVGKGLGGFATGRMIGGMLGSARIGGLVGSLAGGPVGVAIGLAATGIMAGLGKLTDSVRNVIDILNEMSSERATESTSLRRKMQMSSEMFGIDPREVDKIDRKIYSLREREQQYYRHGMSGRDITSSAIDWLHLLGTKETGGTFADEQQAFDFSAALSAIAKMNGLSALEYETVRYQGMQILSKGYADILDVKPLLNSAPGFVRDLLQQTGMSRGEFLESGRSRAFTSDKFIDALMNVQRYYETLSDRASSRTAEQQDEAARNIIGAASVWDEMYKKTKAESNRQVTNAIVQGGLAEQMKESWYKMWSDTNDAQDGITRKVNFEKQLTYQVWLGVSDIYAAWIVVKNIIDLVANTLMFIGEEIYAVIRGMFDLLTNGFSSLMAGFYRLIGAVPFMDKESYNNLADSVDPNSRNNLMRRAYEDASEKMADKIIEADLAGGRNRIAETMPELFNDKVKVGEHEEQVPKFTEVTVIERSSDPYGTIGNWTLSEIQQGYKVVSPGQFFGSVTNKRTIQDGTEGVIVPDYATLLNEDRLRRVVYSGLNSDDSVSRAADRSALVENLKRELSSGNIKLDDDTVKKFGLRGNEDAYTWQSIALSRPGGALDKYIKRNSQDLDDIRVAMEKREKLHEDAKQAYENMKAPYIPKIAGNVQDIKDGKGKGASQILDILKEIAGVTVINKVTKVRPDVVFNFGSYGRSGNLEDPNLRRVGDLEMRQLAKDISKFAGSFDDDDDLIVNGVPTAQ